MRCLQQVVFLVALALMRHAAVILAATAIPSAFSGVGGIVANRGTSALGTSRQHPQQQHIQHRATKLQQSGDGLKRKAAHHLAEFGREMLATQQTKRCNIMRMGAAWGEHFLCSELKPRDPSTCVFYSYGISSDYSFDTMMADEWGCKGVALDPSVTHPSKLHPKVTFHNIAARTMDAAEDAEQWDLVTTVPGLKKFLGHERINVLKMDCEGCEYALAQDILLEDARFLHSVDQLAIEIHVSQKWLKSEAHGHHLGMLYALAKEAGMCVAETVFTGCAPDDEAPGCHPVLQDAGFPCEKGRMCINVLLARV